MTSDESVTIPAELVPYVALGLRVALTELSARVNLQRDSLTDPDIVKAPKVFRMGIEGSANQGEELHRMLAQGLERLPDAIRPRDDLMTPPKRP